MGVKNLWDILESCKKTLPLHHLQNKRLCIDLSCWIVQLQNVNKSHCPTKDKVYLRGLFHRLRALIALNCRLIFVADGSIPAIKLSTYRQRLNLGNEANQDETKSGKVSSVRRNMGSEFSCMVKEAKVLGMALGIPCLDGIEEAEAQCALLNSEALCDGCFTSDSDVFLFGARTVYRDICLGEGGYVVCYEMADIELKLGFGRNSLITLALVLGSDYSEGVHGLGRESACRIVKSVGDSAVLQKIASEGFSFLKKPNGANKQGKAMRCNYMDDGSDFELHTDGSNRLRSGCQFMDVINAYLKPKCHHVDSDVVHGVLGLYPFQRSKLHQICVQFFEWPPEKTDEYILPKIAERDLRRFSNLCSTSTNLGVQLPLEEMPVRCPISEIVKKRRVHGRDCFEVSWEEIDGLKTSIVPADLVESACPEKISEFEERRAQGKKPNQRRLRMEKSEKRAALNGIDLKLEKLLLNIERESTVSRGCSSAAITLDELISETKFDTMNQGLKPNEGSKIVGVRSSLSSCNSSAYGAVEEVIDLVSPSPEVRAVSKCPETDIQHLELINLSESESDTSPEHSKKAKELRLFLASIREDLS